MVTPIWGTTGGAGADFSEITNFFKAAIVTPPAAGWTAAEVNALRWRFGGCTSVDVSPIPTCQALMLEVDWSAAPAGPATLYGASAMALTVARAVAATRQTFSSLDRPVAFAAATAGQVSVPAVTHYGSTSLAVTAQVQTAGQRKAFGQVARPSSFAATTAAQRKTFSAVARPATFAAVTQARRTTLSAVVRPFTFAATTSGVAGVPVVTHYGAVAAAYSVGTATWGQRRTTRDPRPTGRSHDGDRRTTQDVRGGRSSRHLRRCRTGSSYGTLVDRHPAPGEHGHSSSIGERRARRPYRQPSRPSTAARRRTTGVDCPASHVRLYDWAWPPQNVRVIARPTGFAAATQARIRALSQSSAQLTFAAATAGIRDTGLKYGAVSRAVAFGAVVAGRRKTFGQVARLSSFAAVTAARRRTTGQVATVAVFTPATQARRQTFGTVARPIALVIDTRGVTTIGAVTYFGAVALPMSLLRDTAATRRTFARTATALLFGEVTQGRRKRLGATSLTLTVVETTTGRRKTFAALALPLALERTTQGRSTALSSLTAAFTFRALTQGLARGLLVFEVRVGDRALTYALLEDRPLTRALLGDTARTDLAITARAVGRTRLDDLPLTELTTRP